MTRRVISLLAAAAVACAVLPAAAADTVVLEYNNETALEQAFDRDGDTIATAGFVGIGFAENIAVALEALFLDSAHTDAEGRGHPRNLTLVYAAAARLGVQFTGGITVQTYQTAIALAEHGFGPALVDEFTTRLERGDDLSIETFAAQHPEHADALLRLLGEGLIHLTSLAMVATKQALAGLLEHVEVKAAQVFAAIQLQLVDHRVEFINLVVGQYLGLQLRGASQRVAVDLEQLRGRHRIGRGVEVTGVGKQKAQRVTDAAVRINHPGQDFVVDVQVARIVGRRHPQACDFGTELAGHGLRIDRIAQ